MSTFDINATYRTLDAIISAHSVQECHELARAEMKRMARAFNAEPWYEMTWDGEAGAFRVVDTGDGDA